VEAVAATGLAAGFLGYLGYARRAASESSCGCLSSRRTDGVSWRSFARVGLLLLAGLLATQAAGYWWDVVATRPLLAAVVLLVEAVAVVMLSPELDSHWLPPLRELQVRLPRPHFGGSGVPLHFSVRQLKKSPAYQRVGRLLNSDVLEHWNDEEWRIVCYSARYQGRPATAAFAVPLLRYDPAAVRVALVDEFAGATLLTVAREPEDDTGQRDGAANARADAAGAAVAWSMRPRIR
jgi:hypothetical protein